MSILVPNYYHKFKCIADRCRHSCCIGWEIDIDDQALALYQSFHDDLGEKLKNSISFEDGAHFILDSKERCPFLNQTGLCDIISQKGEAALCQICADHPRFRNNFVHFEELGLGLCCEEAARLILTQKEATQWVPLINNNQLIIEEWEEEFILKRNAIMKILQDRALPYFKRKEIIFNDYSISGKSFDEWRNLLLKAEKMTPDLDGYLKGLNVADILREQEWALPLEQLSAYFIYRHLFGAMDDDLFKERLEMALMFSEIICRIAKDRSGGFSTEKLIDTARLFSSEIEYSDQNIELMLSK